MSAEALIVEMIDNPEEFGELATFVQEYSGIDETLQEKVDEAKTNQWRRR
ncbi:MAG: phage tail assembly chaperone [Roseburia sp.]